MATPERPEGQARNGSLALALGAPTRPMARAARSRRLASSCSHRITGAQPELARMIDDASCDV